jgi:hypothetical protein
MTMQAMNAEEYHPNPAVRRIRAKLRGMTGMAKPQGENAERDPVVRTEVKPHDDGTAHVVAHRKSGRAEIHEHPHEKAAKDHARTMMSGGGNRGRGTDVASAMSDPEDDRNDGDRNEDDRNEVGRNKAGRNKDDWDDDMDESNSRSGEKPPKGLFASYRDDDDDRDYDEDDEEDDGYDRDEDEDEDEDEDYDEDADQDEDEYPDDDEEDEEDEECPSCGWWMAAGRCPQCGYEKEEYAYDDDEDGD